MSKGNFRLLTIAALCVATLAATTGAASGLFGPDRVATLLGVETTAQPLSIAAPKLAKNEQLVNAAYGSASPTAVDQYFSCDGSSFISSVWSTSNSGPFTSPFTSGNTAVFAIASPSCTASAAGGIAVGGLRAEQSFAYLSPSGTLGTGGTVATINVFSGKVLDLASLNISTALGTGLIKSGSGIYASANTNAFPGGFTLNSGTVVIGTLNALGNGGPLTINGGTIAAKSTQTVTSRYSSVTVGGISRSAA